MRYFDDEYAVLLGASSGGADVVLRVDRVQPEFYETFIGGALDVKLVGCGDPERLTSFAEINKGEFIWNYEYDETAKVFTILVDGGEELKTGCSAVEESMSDLTLAEMDLKLIGLTRTLKREWEESRRTTRKLSKLTQMLDHELYNESRNLEAKQEFYINEYPERADAVTHGLQFCTRISNLKDRILREE